MRSTTENRIEFLSFLPVSYFRRYFFLRVYFVSLLLTTKTLLLRFYRYLLWVRDDFLREKKNKNHKVFLCEFPTGLGGGGMIIEHCTEFTGPRKRFYSVVVPSCSLCLSVCRPLSRASRGSRWNLKPRNVSKNNITFISFNALGNAATRSHTTPTCRRQLIIFVLYIYIYIFIVTAGPSRGTEPYARTFVYVLTIQFRTCSSTAGRRRYTTRVLYETSRPRAHAAYNIIRYCY